jgi:hypothetical protein
MLTAAAREGIVTDARPATASARHPVLSFAFMLISFPLKSHEATGSAQPHRDENLLPVALD